MPVDMPGRYIAALRETRAAQDDLMRAQDDLMARLELAPRLIDGGLLVLRALILSAPTPRAYVAVVAHLTDPQRELVEAVDRHSTLALSLLPEGAR